MHSSVVPAEGSGLTMIGHGERLLQLIEKKHSSVAAAAIFMKEVGYEINEGQLYRIIKGQWPTKKQVEMICEFFEVEEECFLFGKCYMSRKHSDLMDGLSPKMRIMAEALVEKVVETVSDKSNELGLK